jgi:Tol biopolymer transport system component
MLTPGTRLNSYEIVASIGAGGMGEVYRARDTKLNREVAIKVLPEHLAVNPDAMARFEREAQAVAALSHPNILAIHDFGVTELVIDGKSTKRAYAVTELLDGEPLRAKLEHGALPVRKATEYALQIVHGIAAAHQKGVVHRDLKPENIYVTNDGRVKILDFGLAKVTGPTADGSLLQTHSGLGTSPGTVMGTVGYMSPEQVRGLPIDQRTDIFSFGVVLYEMLSGRRAFRGDSNVETMNAILKEDPPELSVSGSPTPPALDRILRRCLEKNANERFHSAHDLGLALETLSAATSTQSGQAVAVTDAPRSRNRFLPFLLLGGAVAVAAGAYLAGHKSAAPATAELPSYQRLTFRRGPLATARYAGDGKTVIYSARWEDEPRALFSTQPGSPESMQLPYGEADIASVSSTGELALILKRRSLRGFATLGTLARSPLSGGAAREVLADVQGADWLPDGSGLAVSRLTGERYRIEFPIGKPVYDTVGFVTDPRVSPDGTLVAFADHPLLGDDRGTLAVVDRAGKVRTFPGDYSSIQGIAWANGGREIWFTGSETSNARSLFTMTLDGTRRTILRVPGSLQLGDVGADGSVLLWEQNTRSGIMGHLPDGKGDRDLSWFDWSTVPRLSDDGKTLLFNEQGDAAEGGYAVYVRPTDGRPAVRLGTGLGSALSPDGKWVLTIRLDKVSEWVLLPTGVGEAKHIPADPLTLNVGRFTPDGAHIVFGGFEPGRSGRVFVQDLAGGKPKPITPEGVRGPVSWDTTLTAADGKLYPADGGAPRPIPGLEPDERVEGWAADNRTVFVRQVPPTYPNHRVFRLDIATGKRTLLHEIGPVPGAAPGPWFYITPDGSSYAYSYNVSQGVLYRAVGLK